VSALPDPIQKTCLQKPEFWRTLKITLFGTETAINIGYSCQLLTDELVEVYIVDAHTYEEVELQLGKLRDNINTAEKSEGVNGGPTAVSVVTFRWGKDERSEEELLFSTHTSAVVGASSHYVVLLLPCIAKILMNLFLTW